MADFKLTEADDDWCSKCLNVLNLDRYIRNTSTVELTGFTAVGAEYTVRVTRWAYIQWGSDRSPWSCEWIKHWPCEDGVYVPPEVQYINNLEALRNHLSTLVNLSGRHEQLFFRCLRTCLGHTTND